MGGIQGADALSEHGTGADSSPCAADQHVGDDAAHSDLTAPVFSNDNPDINDYMWEYQWGVEVMEQLLGI